MVLDFWFLCILTDLINSPETREKLFWRKSCPRIRPELFLAAVSASVLQVAMRCGVSSDKVKNVIIWGNHSSTQYPDVHHAKVNVSGSEVSAYDAVKNDAWLRGDFISVSAPPAGRKR